MNKRWTHTLNIVTILAIILLGCIFVVDTINADQHENIPVDTNNNKTDLEPLNIPNDSVLNLIPNTAMGVVYCPSLLKLDDSINLLISNLIPQGGPQPEYLAQMLAEAFGAGFESLSELEDLGLDLDADFAIFTTSLDPPILSAVVHLTDPEAIKQVIDAEAEGSEPIQYNGVTYWNSTEGSGSFAIIEDTLIFSQQPEVCENVIDVKGGSHQSIIKNQDFHKYLTNIIKGTEQISAFINLEVVIEPFMNTIQEELQSTIDSIQSDPDSMGAIPFMEGMFGTVVDLLDDLKSFSLSIQIDGTDVQLSQFLQFTKDGKVQAVLEKMKPGEMTLLNDLPNSSFMSGGFNINQQMIYDWVMLWINALTSNDADVGVEIDKEKLENLFQEMNDFYDALGDESSLSVNLNDTFMPDYLVIYELKDEQKMMKYMDEKFLEQMQNSVKIMRDTMGDSPQLSMYDGAYVGNPIIYNDVEIKTFVFPNFGNVFADTPPELAMFFPDEWNISYAISEGLLYLGFGGTQQIQATLDSKAKLTESIAENVSYQNLLTKLGTDNNLLLGISPLTTAKSITDIVSNAQPDAAGEMNMFLGILLGIPENYSIGISAKVHDGGIGTKLLVTLGDFRQLIQTITMLSGMEQMQ